MLIIISELRLQDESTTNNENVILDQIETFYKNLYTSERNFSDEASDLFVCNLEIPNLRDEERDNLEGPLTYDECRKALETSQNDKAPGENIRLINDVMEITKTQNLPGILTSLDFRKAFDSLERPFIMKTLDYL